MSKIDEQKNQDQLDDLDVDTLDDESRRALLGKIARVGAAVIPVSAVMLDAKKASAVGTSPGLGL